MPYPSIIRYLIIAVLPFLFFSCKKKEDPIKSVNILFPTNTEQLMKCHKYVIKWDVIENSGDVYIQLLKNDKLLKVISRGTKNDGIYNWYIQNLSELAGNDCFKIQIGSLAETNIIGQSKSSFTILNDTTAYARRIELLSPNGGEVWNGSVMHEIIIEKNFTENINIYIYLDKDLRAYLLDIPGDSINIWCRGWQANNKYSIKVCSNLYPDITDNSDEFFEISGGGK